MQCFTHSDASARGLCKSCNRALCLDCLAEVGKSIACKNRCETDVENLDAMLRRSLQVTADPAFDDVTTVTRTATSFIAFTDIFNVVIGAIFITFALYRSNVFAAIIGAAFFAFGLLSLVRNRQISIGKKPTLLGPK